MYTAQYSLLSGIWLMCLHSVVDRRTRSVALCGVVVTCPFGFAQSTTEAGSAEAAAGGDEARAAAGAGQEAKASLLQKLLSQ